VTVTLTRNGRGAVNAAAVEDDYSTSRDSTNAISCGAMIDTSRLDRFRCAWLGLIMRSNARDARAMLEQLQPGELTGELEIVARAAWVAVARGESPRWPAVRDAAYSAGFVDERHHAVLTALLVDLTNSRPPSRGMLAAAYAPPHMARALAEQEMREARRG